MSTVSADDTPLSHIDEAELEHELEARKAARKANPRSPEDNPSAKFAGGSAAAAEARSAAAARRGKVVRKKRSQREAADQAARDRAFEEAKAQASRSASRSSRGTRQRVRGAASRAKEAFAGRDPKIVGHYKTLDLPYGSDFAEVKQAYRKLMRKYHPDLHGGSPKKQKAATELSMRVTQAYNALEVHLQGGPNRS